MIIVTTATISTDALDRLIQHVEDAGLRAHVSRGEQRTIVGCIGDERLLDEHRLASLEGVERVMPVLKPYKLASREFKVGNTVIALGDSAGTTIGGTDVVVIAGPCSVEGRDMLFDTAHHVQGAGARLLRGGAFQLFPMAGLRLGRVGNPCGHQGGIAILLGLGLGRDRQL